MDEIKNYSISYRDDLAILDRFSTVQFALNPGSNPSRRQSAKMVSSLCSVFPHVKVICHYDYNYHISKYLAYTPEVRKAFLSEVSHLTSIKHSNFLGVVLHTDSVYKKGVLTDMFPESLIRSSYSKTWYDHDTVVSYLDRPSYLTVNSIQMFFSDWIKTFPEKPLFLENNVNTCPHDVLFGNPIELLKSAVLPIAPMGVGVCLDTEHLFASTISQSAVGAIQELKDSVPLLVHLNAIPRKVKRNSRLDLHSSTTLFECSQYDFETYMKLVDYLDDHQIPFVREVNKTTRERERLQLSKWQSK